MKTYITSQIPPHTRSSRRLRAGGLATGAARDAGRGGGGVRERAGRTRDAGDESQRRRVCTNNACGATFRIDRVGIQCPFRDNSLTTSSLVSRSCMYPVSEV